MWKMMDATLPVPADCDRGGKRGDGRTRHKSERGSAKPLDSLASSVLVTSGGGIGGYSTSLSPLVEVPPKTFD